MPKAASQKYDIEFKRVVTEYCAQILENELGQRFVAPFPKDVNSYIQYGNGLKAHAVYLSQYQLLPYERIREYFTDQLNIPLSSGSIFNFINTAYTQLEETQALDIIKANLIKENKTKQKPYIPMQRVSISTEKDNGYITPHLRIGRIYQPMKNEAMMPWMRLAYYPSSTV